MSESNYHHPIRFETRLDAESLPYLKDCRFDGEVFLPFGGLLEMALAGVAEACSTDRVEIRDVRFHRPLFPSKPTALSLTVAERTGFEIKGGPSDEPPTFGLVSGSPAESVAEPCEPVDLAEIAARCPNILEIADLKDGLKSLGFEFGPSFDAVASVKFGNGELLAELELPEHLRPETELYRIHPVFLESCLHLTTAVFGDVPDRPASEKPEEAAMTAPFSVGAFRMHDKPTDRLVVHVVRHERESPDGKTVPVFNVRLLEDSGKVVAELLGLRMRRMGIANARLEPLQSVLYTLDWTKLPARQAQADNRTWLVFADRTGAGDVLIGRLRSQGRRCVAVKTGAAFEQTGPEDFTLDPTNRADFIALLERIGESAKIVPYLWGLDAGDDPGACVEICGSALFLLQTLAETETGAADKSSVFFVTRGAVASDSASESGILQAPLRGLGKVAALETASQWGGLIDLGNSTDSDAAEKLIVECAGTSPEGQILFRDGNRFGARLAALNPTADAAIFSPSPTGTYLVTGGAGAVGLTVARLLVERGAGRVILTGRTPETELPPDVRAALDLFGHLGARVRYRQADVVDFDRIRMVVEEETDAAHPLKGVFHAAGVLDDGILLNLTPKRLETVFAPKIRGAWNLHLLTRDADLDAFVLFSSTSALFGTPGQANYSAANSFLDSLAAFRQAKGLPALSINWGPWADIGMAAGREAFKRTAASAGVRSLPPARACAVLEYALGTGFAQVAAADIDRNSISGRDPNSRIGRLLERFSSSAPKPAAASGNGQGNLAWLLLDAAPEHRRAVVIDHLNREIGSILRLDSADRIDPTQPLSAYGFDSLMAVELAHALSRDLGREIPPANILKNPTLSGIAELLSIETEQDSPPSETKPSEPKNASRRIDEPIAVIGLGCRFPGAENPKEFWELLRNGFDAVSRVPADRWDSDPYSKGQGDKIGNIDFRLGGFLKDVAGFDSLFFKISPREAVQIDPQQRLLLEVAWETLEFAGYAPSSLSGSNTGVFVGTVANEYVNFLAGQNNQDLLDAYSPAGNSVSLAANRVSHVFDFHGPSVALDTACSSSLLAIHSACRSLGNGECDMALAGGVKLMLIAELSVRLARVNLLAADGRCKSFSDQADGFGRGEGCGLVLLKRLSDARRDGDRILAVVRGGAVNHDGRCSSILSPDRDAQIDLLRRALADADVNPAEVDFVEAHAVGSRLSDRIEFGALRAVLDAGRDSNAPCYVGSVKSNIGNLEPAGGVAGFIKAVLALEHGLIPPTLHLTSVNSEIDLDGSALRFPLEPTARPRTDKPMIAGVGSLGFGGTNVHVVLEEFFTAKDAREVGTARGSGRVSSENSSLILHPSSFPYILPLSARSKSALVKLAVAYVEFLDENSDVPIADVCFTAATGRDFFNHRVAVVGANRLEIRTALKEFALGTPSEAWFAGEVRPEQASTLETLDNPGEIARRFVSGANFDWNTIFAEIPRRKVSLPTYPFERKRYWAGTHVPVNVPGLTDGAGFPTAKISKALVQTPADSNVAPFRGDLVLLDSDGKELWRCADLRFEHQTKEKYAAEDFIEWREAAKIQGPPNANRSEGSWVLFTEGGKLGRALAALLEADGDTCFQVRAGDGFEIAPDDSYRVDPSKFEDFRRVFEDIAARKSAPLLGFVHLWALGTPGDVLEPEIFPNLFKGLKAAGPVGDRFGGMWIVGRGWESTVSDGFRVSKKESRVWSMAEALNSKRFGRLVSFIDLDPAMPTGEATLLLGEIGSPSAEPIAFRSGKRFAAVAASRASGRDDSEPTLRDKLKDAPSDVRSRVFREYLIEKVARVLKISRDGIPDDINLIEYGMDSISGTDLMSDLKRDLELPIYLAEVIAKPTVGELADYLASEYDRIHLVNSLRVAPATNGNQAVPTVPTFEHKPRELPTALVPTPARPPATWEKLDTAVFAFSSPRSGSTLFRVMLAGHPDLFSPPELHILSYRTMGERSRKLNPTGMGSGLQRAFMELKKLDKAEGRAYIEDLVRRDAPVRDVYAELTQLAAPKLLVDKTPMNATTLAGLMNAEDIFENGKYIHLIRHPYSVLESIVRTRFDRIFGVHEEDPLATAEYIWTSINQNIADFAERIGREKVHVVRYEDLVADPETTMRGVCGFLNLPFDEALLHPYEGDRMTEGLHVKTRGIGDPNFASRDKIEASLGEVWKTVRLPRPLSGATRRLAQEFGYEFPDHPHPPSPKRPSEENTEKKASAPASTSVLSKADNQVLETTASHRNRIDSALGNGQRITDNGQRHYPLSFGQERLWFLDRLKEGVEANHLPGSIPQTRRLRGTIDETALNRALHEIVRRHDVLRTVFAEIDGRPVQIVREAIPEFFETVDFRNPAVPEIEPDAPAVREFIREFTAKPFDLETGPLIRACLGRLAQDDAVLVIVMHHIVSDGWSVGVLQREFSTLYEAFSAGKPSPLEELTFRYGDYALLQRERLTEAVRDEHVAYWKTKLADTPPLELPTDRPRPASPTMRGNAEILEISPELTQGLKKLGRDEHATLFTTLTAAFQTLLVRYTGTEDVCVGTHVANRDTPEVKPLIGFFVNTLPLRTDLSGNPTFRESLGRVRQTVLEAFRYGELPFERILEELNVERDPSRPSLFQVMVVLQNQPKNPLEIGEARVRKGRSEKKRATCDLTLWVHEQHRRNDLVFKLEYNTDIFEAETIRRLLGHFNALLEAIAANPDTSIGHIDYLSDEEKHRLLVEWNDTGRDFPLDLRVHELIERQALRTPDAVAAIDSNRQLTYAEWNLEADLLGERLKQAGVRPGDFVGLRVERSVEAAVAILAVLKCGAAYVPIDPGYPQARIDFILKDSRVEVLVTDIDLDAWGSGFRLQASGKDSQDFEAVRKLNVLEIQPPFVSNTLNPEPRTLNPVYVIYTSGSTGKPKGVVVTHRNVVNLCFAVVEKFNLTADDRVLQFASLGFDAAVEELFPIWTVGGAVVFREPGPAPSVEELTTFIAQHRVTVFDPPTAYWSIMVRELAVARRRLPDCLRLVVVGGEAAKAEDLSRHHSVAPRSCRWINTYGPTETTVSATWFEPGDTASSAGDPPVGRPLPNVRTYILDQHLQPVPVGVVGELFIGGEGVASGYLNHPELVVEKFIPDPFLNTRTQGHENTKVSTVRGSGWVSSSLITHHSSRRLYRTGDLARFRPDGNIEFRGRSDDQVKVRGFRVELGEVEAALRRCEGVREAAAVADQVDGTTQLIAFVVTQKLTAKDAREEKNTSSENLSLITHHLSRLLPEFMIPARFEPISELPVTPSGKIDRRKLSKTAKRTRIQTVSALAPPKTPTEELIAQIWADILKTEQVGATDNFFSLGGHSLIATRVVAEIRDRLGVAVPLRKLFELPTVAELAQFVEESLRADGRSSQSPPAFEIVDRGGPLPVSYQQQRLWMIEEFKRRGGVAGATAGIPFVLKFDESIDPALIGQALNDVARRQESLRTTYAADGARPVQIVRDDLTITLEVVDSGLADGDGVLDGPFREHLRRPFDLRTEPPVRAALLRGPKNLLLLVFHHIAVDGWSMGIFFREAVAAFRHRTQGVEPRFPELPIGYVDYAHRQRNLLPDEYWQPHIDYWRETLAGMPERLALPTDKARFSNRSFRCGNEIVEFSEDLTNRVQTFARRSGATLFMTLAAGFKILLARYSGQEDLCVGTHASGRTEAEINQVIGFFVNTLPLRTKLDGDPSFAEVLRRVRETTLGAFSHQELPFEKLLDALHPTRDVTRPPFFQTALVLQNFRAKKADRKDGKVRRIERSLKHRQTASPFDLTLWVRERSDKLECRLEYAAELFEPETVRSLLSALETLLEAGVSEPETPISRLPLSAPVTGHWSLITGHSSPSSDLLHHLFEARARLAPDAPALVSENEVLTYGELNARADALAGNLQQAGVREGANVGLCVEDGFNLVTGMLGILKAGAAFVPVDPSYPQARIDFMVEDAGLSVIVTDSDNQGSEEGKGSGFRVQGSGNPCRDFEGFGKLNVSVIPTSFVSNTPNAEPRTLNPVYVIYTSGSTGKPKGVVIPHGAAVNLAIQAAAKFDLNENDRVLQFASPSFDTVIEEVFPALSVGAAIVVKDGVRKLSFREFHALIEKCGITVLDLPTAFWHEWANRLSKTRGQVPDSLRLIVIGGEKAEIEFFRKWLECTKGAVRLVNTYGPTETTVSATMFDPDDEFDSATATGLPIGKPVDGNTVFVLDSNLRPVPQGFPGELCIGGEGVALGYLNRPELTAEKFISVFPAKEVSTACGSGRGSSENSSLVTHHASLRLYRTGDLVRQRPDGNLEFLGRLDDQVKVRGFRIEPGEIEAALLSIPEVERAAAVAERKDGNTRLIAFIVLDKKSVPLAVAGGFSSFIIHHSSFLRTVLPEHMIPSVVVVESFPMTAGGKIDRQALLAGLEDGREKSGVEFIAPRNPIEELTANVWTEILRAENVGATDNFFLMGGNSLLATQVVAELHDRFNVEIPLRRLFETPTVAGLAEFIAGRKQASDIPPIEPVSREGDLSLSFAQERLWFLDRFSPGDTTYNLTGAYRLRGDLDFSALRRAFEEVAERHEILRAVFTQTDGVPVLKIHGDASVPFSILDLRGMPSEEIRDRVRAEISEFSRLPFDLENGPLVRIRLLQAAENETVLLVSMHHIVSDGWSARIFVREAAAAYSAFSKGTTPSLPELPIQYVDFAAWQRKRFAGDALDSQIAYWKNKLGNAPFAVNLPTDRPRPAELVHQGGMVALSIDRELTDSVKALGRREGTTLFMTLLAAFQSLLHRYSGDGTILVGSPIAGRSRRETESLIGFFVNTVVLRADFTESISFRELLGQVRETNLDAFANQDLPFARLVEILQPERALNRSPLFQVMFALQNLPATDAESLDVAFRPLRESTDDFESPAKFDLTLTVREGKTGLRALLQFNSVLFDAETAERMLNHFEILLRSAVASPETPVTRLPLLTETERRQLAEWNAVREFPVEKCLHELFEEQVNRTPDRIAVSFHEQSLTYRELNDRADSLAVRLREAGVASGSLVGLTVERGLELVVGILGILKAGAAYVPIDPDSPPDRIDFIIEDARLSVIVTDAGNQGSEEEKGSGFRVQGSGKDSQGFKDVRELNVLEIRTPFVSDTPNPEPRTLNPAYVIYTSGSTGRPKGVVVTHRNVVRLFAASQALFNFRQDDVWTLFHSAAFDFSVWELWGALLHGGKLVVVDSWTRRSPDDFLDLLVKERVTVLNQTPSAFKSLLRVESVKRPDLDLRWIVFGGEALHPAMLADWFARRGDDRPRVVNMFGITETTVHVTFKLITKPDAQSHSSPIGRPLPDLQVRLLDKHGQLVPIGVPGEMYVAGDGVASGYLNRPELTAERFLVIDDTRFYKSGDSAKQLPDGQLVHLGRLDSQVKIRGHRIELGEIEAVLKTLPDIRDALVIPRDDPTNDQRLVAYVVSVPPAVAGGFTAEDATVSTVRGSGWVSSENLSLITHHLSRRLPAYMIPSAFVVLDSFPLTVNGKINLNALPEPETESLNQLPGVERKTPTEELVFDTWADVLGRKHIGARENFFEAGGHSLSAVRLATRLQGTFGIEISVRTIFEYPTIATLAEYIEGIRAASDSDQIVSLSPLVPIPRTGPLPLSHQQNRLWLLERLKHTLGLEAASFSGIPLILKMPGKIDAATLAASFNDIVSRHEILRTTFAEIDGEPVQIVHPNVLRDFDIVDCTALEPLESEAKKSVRAFIKTPFDLTVGPPVRAALFKIREGEDRLVVVFHHIVSDGWSAGIFIRELKASYRSHRNGQSPALPALPVQYADFAHRQRLPISETVWERHLDYWKTKLADAPSALNPPTDKARPKRRNFKTKFEEFEFSAETTTDLKAFGNREGATLFMTLLAGFQTLLSRFSGQDDVCCGTYAANRGEAEIENLIGFFVNTLALRTDLSGNPTFREVAGRVRETVLEAFAHQAVPFEKVVEALRPGRTLDLTPFFQVALVLQPSRGSRANETANPTTEHEFERAHSLSPFDLTMWAREKRGKLQIRLEYAAELFDPRTIRCLLEAFEAMLTGGVRNPDLTVEELPLRLGKHRIEFSEFEPTAERVPIHRMFERQAASAPDSPAVVFCDCDALVPISYGRLDCLSNELAERLRDRGIVAGDVVGLCVRPSVEMIVGLLGVLKAGAAFLPLDPNYPQSRLDFMLADSGARMLLTTEVLKQRFTAFSRPIVALEEFNAKAGTRHSAFSSNSSLITHHSSRLSPAYVIYTSGSTGTPKGVVVGHGAAANLVREIGSRFALTPEDCVMQFASLSFDTAIEEIFPALARGARIALRDDVRALSFREFHHWIETAGVTVLDLPTAFWHEWVRQTTKSPLGIPASVRLVVLGGEKAEIGDFRDWQRLVGERIKLLNTYGPTETTVTATVFEPDETFDPATAPSLPIGKPLPGVVVQVLDAAFRPVPVGFPGELFIGGEGVAQGYLNHPELTAERFIRNPSFTEKDAKEENKQSSENLLLITHHSSSCLYRTGDRVRMRHDGNLEFLGRFDDQVKLRGFRIELGEVEAALMRLPQVREAVVSIHVRSDHTSNLTAYVVLADETADISVIQHELRKTLPDYMVPTAFVVLGELPKTPNGKINRRNLPKPEVFSTQPEFVGPRNPTEEALAIIFQQVLKLDQVGIHDNFFSLGGHSLAATRLVGEIHKTLQVELPLHRVFEEPTVAGLALAVSHIQAEQPERQHLEAMLTEVEQLSDEEALALLAEDFTDEEMAE